MRWKRSSGVMGSGCGRPDGSEDERGAREVPGELDEDGETGHLVLDSLAASAERLGMCGIYRTRTEFEDSMEGLGMGSSRIYASICHFKMK